MTFVTRRGSDRFELRESRRTPDGPRARTLATFAVLTDDVLQQAAERAAGPLDAHAVRDAARRVGAPVASSPVVEAARTLLGQLATGARPSPAMAALLRDALGPTMEPPDHVRAAAAWAAAATEERAEALHELLLLADRLPPPRTNADLRFPRMASRLA